MYYINKIVFGFLNPMAVGLMILFSGIVLGCLNRRRAAWTCICVGFLWLLVWAHPMLMPDMARRLERLYPPQLAEDMPQADVIVLLGGGMSKGDGESIYPEMHQGADRVWHAARLYKAGKAPIIFTSGTNEAFASAVLLKDLGVPEAAVVVEPESRNTEENANAVAALIQARLSRTASRSQQPMAHKHRILLVTSAWHMRRALFVFERAFHHVASGLDVQVIPAAADYEALNNKNEFSFAALSPTVDCMYNRSVMYKEILGYWGYRLLCR